MVYVSFSGHLKETIKQKFEVNHFNLAVIPGGCTSVCQPLDVSINKPFKEHLKKEWDEWMRNGGNGVTAGGYLRRASISDVCKWVKNAWDSISSELILNSFKKCKITNPIDELLDEAFVEDKENTENNMSHDIYYSDDLEII